MDSSRDVTIIGAGPGGGFTARECAKSGLRTLLLEENPAPGEPVHCGECLSIYATENVGIRLPPKAVSETVKGVRVIFPKGNDCVWNENGVVLEKHLFEQWIAREAEAAGAEVKLNTRVSGIQRENGQWNLATSNGNYSSKLLVDASGSAQFVSRALNLNPRSETVIGIQYELQDIPRSGYLDFYIHPKYAPHGYLWMIPKSNGRANVGLVTTQKNMAKKLLDEWMRNEMGWGGKISNKTFGGLIPISGPVPKTVSEGLLLVGDAAGFTSPMFEGGTHLAMKSGALAAQVAQKAIQTNDFSEATLGEYDRLWKAHFP
ncbi:MAG: NAD(P)/FAD-dependent oxidoreductase, partial [Candidatus Diapherotrites archaeon]|nr:NAD(P)/FAD-dependent oxidoreductase [Candidatus Diapherotrites archaeon]